MNFEIQHSPNSCHANVVKKDASTFHALSLKGVGDQLARVDFKGKEVIGWWLIHVYKTLYHAIEKISK